MISHTLYDQPPYEASQRQPKPLDTGTAATNTSALHARPGRRGPGCKGRGATLGPRPHAALEPTVSRGHTPEIRCTSAPCTHAPNLERGDWKRGTGLPAKGHPQAMRCIFPKPLELPADPKELPC